MPIDFDLRHPDGTPVYVDLDTYTDPMTGAQIDGVSVSFLNPGAADSNKDLFPEHKVPMGGLMFGDSAYVGGADNVLRDENNALRDEAEALHNSLAKQGEVLLAHVNLIATLRKELQEHVDSVATLREERDHARAKVAGLKSMRERLANSQMQLEIDLSKCQRQAKADRDGHAYDIRMMRREAKGSNAPAPK
ncbi:hypothetical protein T484DRAFT_1861975 [Baffinella frigidus]|nr:hypothetical protein T484DRAFT_1861975 [Cryptophyta sp. CCMP2293]